MGLEVRKHRVEPGFEEGPVESRRSGIGVWVSLLERGPERGRDQPAAMLAEARPIGRVLRQT